MHLLQHPIFPLIPLLLKPEMPGSLIGFDGLGTPYGVIGCPCSCGRHNVIIIAKREPACLLIRYETSKVHTVVIAGHLNLFFLAFKERHAPEHSK